MYKCMYKSMISTMINTKRARSAIGGSRASQRERNRSDKKEKPEKRKCKIVGQRAPRRTPYPLYLKLIVYKGFGH